MSDSAAKSLELPQEWLLQYTDIWERLYSKPVAFQELFVAKDESEEALFRELTETRLPLSSSSRPAPKTMLEATKDRDVLLLKQQVDSLHRYIERMRDLLALGEERLQERRPKRWMGLLGPAAPSFSWNSPSGETPGTFFELSSPEADAGLACVVLAAGMQVEAYWHVSRMRGASEEVAATELQEATRLLREGAGLLLRASESFLAQARASLPGERPAEVMPAFARSVGEGMLAEAQGLAATRAQQRGAKAQLVAALHAGAAQMFEASAATVRSNLTQFNRLDFRQRAWLSISAQAHRARAFLVLSSDLLARDCAGEAVQHARAAVECLGKAQGVAGEVARWRRVVGAWVADAGAWLGRVERVNGMVYFQRVPNDDPHLPDGKQVVTAIEVAEGGGRGEGGGAGAGAGVAADA